MATLIGPRAQAEAERLADDQVILIMAVEIAQKAEEGKLDPAVFAHEDGGPRFQFMQAANSRYMELCRILQVPDQHETIGAVGHAVLGRVEWAREEIRTIRAQQERDGVTFIAGK